MPRLLGLLPHQVSHRPKTHLHDFLQFDFLLPWATRELGKRTYGLPAVREVEAVEDEGGRGFINAEAGPSRLVERATRKIQIKQVKVQRQTEQLHVRDPSTASTPSSQTIARTIAPVPIPRQVYLPLPQDSPRRLQPAPPLYDPSSTSTTFIGKLARPNLSGKLAHPVSFSARTAAPPSRYRSFIHKQLTSPNPPSATHLYNHLRAKPSLITRQAATTLSRYAHRTGHWKIARKMQRLASRMDYGTWQSEARGKVTIPRGTVISGWARRRWPPGRARRDVYSTMGALHWTLVTGKEVLTLAEMVAQIRRACREEWRGTIGTNEALLDLFQLCVVYSSERGLDLWRQFHEICPDIRPSRQVLHVLVSNTLWPLKDISSRRQEVIDEIMGLDHEPQVRQFLESHGVPRDLMRNVQRPSLALPLPVDAVVNQTLAEVLQHFREVWRIYPRCATWRLIFYYALSTRQPEIGKLAFDGWWTAEGYAEGAGRGEGDSPRFLRRGKERARWRNVLKWQEGRVDWVYRPSRAYPTRAQREAGEQVGRGEVLEMGREGEGPGEGEEVSEMGREGDEMGRAGEGRSDGWGGNWVWRGEKHQEAAQSAAA